MSEEKREAYEEEIDLYELLLKLKRRWKIIFGTVFVFLIIASLYVLIMRPVYKSSFTVKVPKFFTPAETVRYINYIQKLLKEKRFEDVMQILNLSEEEVKNIYKISSRELRGAKQTVEVSIEVYEPKLISKLANSILDYLNRNEYILERINIKKQEIEDKVKTIEKKIKALEETKKIINRLMSEGTSIYFNPAEIDTIIRNFQIELITLKTQLKTLKGFDISVEPVIPERPEKPQKKLILSVSLVSSFLLGIFLALFVDWLEEARRRHQGT